MSEKKPRVLDVGNCSYDHGSIRRLLEERFQAEVVQQHHRADAIQALKRGRFDLVLVNRVFDRDGDDGMELIRTIKSDPALAETPVMLISNYEQYQKQAMEAGALPGFGKSALSSPETAERLDAVLHTSS
jgi:CheY-like chemotaxis protein